LADPERAIVHESPHLLAARWRAVQVGTRWQEHRLSDATQADLWLQPLDGTAARQLTHFAAERTINDYAWSRDGKRLAVTRQSIGNEIVPVQGFASAFEPLKHPQDERSHSASVA
jgi:hypothetical protein